MNSRKKVNKYRGSKTHGGGAMKKRRGAGSRGGRGRAGSGKRGDQKKTLYWKTWQMGKNGFFKHNANEVSTVNIAELDRNVSDLVQEGNASKKGDTIIIDLTNLGIDKLLGSGSLTHKLTITVAVATAKAIEKVEAAGGSVHLANAEDEE